MPVVQGSGYTSPPVLTLTGGGGSGVTTKTYLGNNGNVTKVDVLAQGSGYYGLPSVSINGNLIEGGEPASFGVVLGNNNNCKV